MSPRSLTNWTKHWNKLSRHTPRRSPARRTRLLLRLELLEDRLVPAVINIVAGNGTAGYGGDGGPATAAQLDGPTGVAFDAAGDLFITDETNNVIRMVSPAGVITTVAGNGTPGYSGDGGPATAARLNHPFGVTVDAAGDVFIADYSNNVIREVSPAGVINTVAGNGTPGYSGDGGPATAAQLNGPFVVAVDAAGDLFIADAGNFVIRKVSPAGVITTVAGNGSYGYSGDGGIATAAQLSNPEGVAVDSAGDLFIADAENNVIRKVSPAGVITTVAGNGTPGYSGDGGLATAAQFAVTVGVAVNAAGDLFIADQNNNAIREVGPAGIINTVAAGLDDPVGLTVGATGDMFIPDYGSNRILEVSPPLSVSPFTATDLQRVLSPSGPVTIQAGGGITPATVLGAVNGLTNVTQPVTVILDLGGGTFSTGGVAANPPANVSLVIQNGTLDPSDPALTVAGGQVFVVNVTLTTTSDNPTLLVTGGNVTLRNDVVQESTGFTDAAIAVTGGTVDLGTFSDPGNNIVNINGAGQFIQNTTSNPIPAIGDSFEINGTLVPNFFAVLNTADSGPGSLRQAILDANTAGNNTAGPDTIEFDIGGGGAEHRTCFRPADPH